MELDLIFGCLGIVGGLLTACGDMLLDLKGPDNEKLGRDGLIDSALDHMAPWRFPASILCAAFGVPLILLGITALARQMALGQESFGLWFWLVGAAGCTGALFIHTGCCLWPIIYQTMKPRHTLEDIDRVTHAVYSAIRVPFFLLYALLALGTSVMIWAALGKGFLDLSPWCAVLTPPPLCVVGILLKKVQPRVFCDLPWIIMPSLGMGCMGLLAVLNIL